MARENRGITLIALVVTIVILLILSGITIYGGNNSLKTTKSNKLQAELEMVQHACLEKYTEYKVTKNESLLAGTPISFADAEALAEEMEHSLPEENVGDQPYYRLYPSQMEKLGLSEGEDTYIINYEKGIVMNETNKVTDTGEFLFKDTNN